jgi:HK97 gp10 family phage protein
VSEIVWKDWNPQRVKAAIAGQVAQNMEVACQFVAGQAKALAPRRGGRLISEIDIAIEVGAYGNVVEGRVGVRRGKAFYARFQELGTRFTRAQPFLRPAVFNNAREIMRIIAGQ